MKQLTHIIGLPFTLLNSSFNPLGTTFPNDIILPSRSLLKKNLNSNEANPVVWDNYKIYRIMKEEITLGYLVTLLNHSSDVALPALSDHYINFAAKALANNNLFKTKTLFQLSNTELFLKAILDNQLSDPEIIRLNFNETLANKADKYCLLIVEANNLSTRQLKTALSSIFHKEILEYRNYCTIIWSYSFTEYFSIYSYPEFQKLLKKYELHAALSNGFLDSAMLRNAYLQCREAMRLYSSLYPAEYFSQYDEIIVAHLADIASKQNISLIGLIHPSILWIQEYDRENHTEYLRTLIAYISQNYNISKTSTVLNLHRNTVYMQIKYLKEHFLIDFDNYKLQYKIQISITLLCYLELSNVDKLIGYDHAE